MDNLKLIIGRSNPKLGHDIARQLGILPCETFIGNFADGEIRFKIGEDIRGKDVFIIQSTFPNADNLLELLIMIDAARRSSASRVTAVIPYFGYARQDRKDEPRVPITSKLVANLIVGAGADRVLTMDLHAAQIQGFFDIPTDQLVSDNLFKHHIETDVFGRFDCNPREDFVIVSPDIGGVKRVENIASRLDLPIAVIYKKRKKITREAQAMKIVGEVMDKHIIILDDIIDTAGTMKQACLKLKGEGCGKIFICSTHPLLSGPAMERLDSAEIEGLTITNTIPLEASKNRDYINIIETGRFFAMAIHHIHFEKSVSVLLYEDNTLDLWEN
ncbi:ribose-phosphate diphosphokinase [bacterium]|nr:ribose-phosphate diphosphokinase [bacterium]